MRDLADDCAASCEAVAGIGGTFVQRMTRRPDAADGRSSALPACGCGGRPRWEAAGREGAEVIRCSKCGRRHGPSRSRFELATMWRSWRAG